MIDKITLVIINEFMHLQRKANELDAFISNNQQPTLKMISPRNFPLHNHNNNYFSNPYQEQKINPIASQRNISPTRNNNRKPMISPTRATRNKQNNINQNNRIQSKQETDRNKENYCSNENHRTRKAQFIIHIDEEDMYYCKVCAAQAASQGFTVTKIGGLNNKKTKILPNYPQYSSNKRYNQLLELMGQILILQKQFKNVGSKQVTDYYAEQEDMLNNFYDQIQELVNRMREDHMADIRAESAKNVKAADIVCQGLKQHMQDLNEVWQDIEENINTIVQKVDGPLFEECYSKYQNLNQTFRYKLEQYQSTFDHFTSYDKNQLNSRIKYFQDHLIQLWDQNINNEQQPTKKKLSADRTKAVTLPTTKNIIVNPIKTVHQNLPHNIGQHNCEGNVAFRNLFQSQQDCRMPQASPQFKTF